MPQITKSHLKPRKVRVGAQSHPWMNGDIRKLVNRRYKLLIKTQRTAKGSPE